MADAAAALLPAPEYVAVASLNGAQSPDKSDQAPLSERTVIVWPDHDEPGGHYAPKVRRLALHTRAGGARGPAAELRGRSRRGARHLPRLTGFPRRRGRLKTTGRAYAALPRHTTGPAFIEALARDLARLPEIIRRPSRPSLMSTCRWATCGCPESGRRAATAFDIRQGTYTKTREQGEEWGQPETGMPLQLNTFPVVSVILDIP